METNRLCFFFLFIVGSPVFFFYLISLIISRNIESALCLLGAIGILFVINLILSQLDRFKQIQAIVENVIDKYPNARFTLLETKSLVPLLHVLTYFERNSASALLRELGVNTKHQSILDRIQIIKVDNTENPFTNVACYFNAQEEAFIFVPRTDLKEDPLGRYIVYHEIAHSSFMSRKKEIEYKSIQLQIVTLVLLIPFHLTWNIQGTIIFFMLLLLSSEFIGKHYERKKMKSRIHAELFADQIALDIMEEDDKKMLRNLIRKGLGRGRLIIYDNKMEYPANIMRIAKLANLNKGSIDEGDPTSIEKDLEVNEVETSNTNTLWFLLFLSLIALNSNAVTFYHFSALGVLVILGVIFGNRVRNEWIILSEKISSKIHASPGDDS